MEEESSGYILSPISYSLIFVCNKEKKVVKEEFYCGEDAASVFLDTLIEVEDEMLEYIQTYNEMIELTEEEVSLYIRSSHCAQCGKEFDKDSRKKCRHHDHFTGEYLAPVCQKCNLAMRRQHRIKLLAHNSNGFDSHLILQAMEKSKLQDRQFTVIPGNFQQFKGMSYSNYDFLDSLAFLPSSLSNLVNTLVKTKESSGEKLNLLRESDMVKEIRRKREKGGEEEKDWEGEEELDEQWEEERWEEKDEGEEEEEEEERRWRREREEEEIRRIKREEESKYNNEKYNMLLQKGFFPYDALTSLHYLEKKSFPPKEDFFNHLSGEGISQEDYSHALSCFNLFECENMEDYLKLYNRLDVYLLAEVFTHFQEEAYSNFKLDVTSYWTLPSFAYGKLYN